MAPKEELALSTLRFLLLEAPVEPSAVVGIPGGPGHVSAGRSVLRHRSGSRVNGVPPAPSPRRGEKPMGVSRGACPPSEPGAPRPMFQCVVCFGTRPDSFCALVVVATAVPMEGSRDKDVVTGCWVTASPSWRSVCPASRSSLPRPDLRAQRQGPTLSATFFAFEVGHMQSCF